MSGKVFRRRSMSLVTLGMILAAAFAGIMVQNSTSAASVSPVHVMTDDCPGECYTYICGGEPPTQHVFWDYPDSVSMDELDGGFHDECMAKNCCWFVEEPNPPNNCRHGECWMAPSPSDFLDDIATSAEDGDVERLDELLAEYPMLSLNVERSSIQLGSCSGRFKGNYPVDESVARELEQRMLQRHKPAALSAAVQLTHIARVLF
jgi:hypothetical protein